MRKRDILEEKLVLRDNKKKELEEVETLIAQLDDEIANSCEKDLNSLNTKNCNNYHERYMLELSLYKFNNKRDMNLLVFVVLALFYCFCAFATVMSPFVISVIITMLVGIPILMAKRIFDKSIFGHNLGKLNYEEVKEQIASKDKEIEENKIRIESLKEVKHTISTLKSRSMVRKEILVSEIETLEDEIYAISQCADDFRIKEIDEQIKVLENEKKQLYLEKAKDMSDIIKPVVRIKK